MVALQKKNILDNMQGYVYNFNISLLLTGLQATLLCEPRQELRNQHTTYSVYDRFKT